MNFANSKLFRFHLSTLLGSHSNTKEILTILDEIYKFLKWNNEGRLALRCFGKH